MEKYGTYRVFKNKKTDEILKVNINEELEKKAEDTSEWIELDKDPEANGE